MRFYDSSSLLLLPELPEEKFLLSDITLQELESIKTSSNKDFDTKAKARRLLRNLWSEKDNNRYEVVIFSPQSPEEENLINDRKIMLCAVRSGADTLVTDDYALAAYAMAETSLKVERILDAPKDHYKGFVEKHLTDDELNTLYADQTYNSQNLLTNEYLIIDNDDGKKDALVWDGQRYNNISYSTFDSEFFPYPVKQKDIYQALAMDALLHDQFVLLAGPQGTGKSLLSLSYAMMELAKKRKDKLIIFTNPVSAKDSAEIGFLPGTRKDKLMDASIGGILSSKLGAEKVDGLIHMGKIQLYTLADLRGFSASNAIVYITEAQNLNTYLMQLAITRVEESSQLIIEGDYTSQVDRSAYAGSANGMQRVSEVFRGDENFGMVELQHCYRGAIAKKALEM